MSRFIGEIPTLQLMTIQLGNFVLQWNDMSHSGVVPVTRYRVFRSDGGTFAYVGSSTSLTYTDTTAASNYVNYTWYIVAEYNLGYYSGQSNRVTGGVFPQYMYALGTDGYIHTIEITNRAAPALVQSTNFQANLGATMQFGNRLLVDDTRMIVSYQDASNVPRIRGFDIATNPLIPAFAYAIAPGGETQDWFHPPLLRKNHDFVANGRGWPFFFRASDGLMGAGYWIGWIDGAGYHPHAVSFDPKTKKFYQLYGDGNYFANRYRGGTLADDDSAITALGDSPCRGISVTRLTVSQMLIQAREGLDSVMWFVDWSGNWLGYRIPNPDYYGNYFLGAFNTGQTAPDRLGRCYIRNNVFFTTSRLGLSNVHAVYLTDISNPATPTLLSTLGDHAQQCCDIVIIEDPTVTYAYLIGTTDKKVTVYDITDMTNPVLLSATTFAGLSATIACLGSKHAAISQNGGNNTYLPDV